MRAHKTWKDGNPPYKAMQPQLNGQMKEIHHFRIREPRKQAQLSGMVDQQ
jgi:hypothetical protein